MQIILKNGNVYFMKSIFLFQAAFVVSIVCLRAEFPYENTTLSFKQF